MTSPRAANLLEYVAREKGITEFAFQNPWGQLTPEEIVTNESSIEPRVGHRVTLRAVGQQSLRSSHTDPTDTDTPGKKLWHQIFEDLLENLVSTRVAELPELKKRDRVHAEARRTLRKVISRLRELSELDANWDSYGAKPMTAQAATAAIELVSDLLDNCHEIDPKRFNPWMIAPLADGGVQLEWRLDSSAVEVEIDPDGKLHYLIELDNKVVAESDDGQETTKSEVIGKVCDIVAAD
jgi:hypothetical protein